MFHVEQGQQWADLLQKGALELGLSLNAQQVKNFSIYVRELRSWNKKINLTAIRSEREIAVKHFLDSLAYSKALPPKTGSLLDVGSGAGFPGLPLKLLYPDLGVTLLEPSSKKAAFLRYLIGTLQLEGVTVVSQRIQEFARASRHRFTSIVTRALKLDGILPFVGSLLQNHGCVVLCHTKPLALSLQQFGMTVKNEIVYELPYGCGHRVLTVLKPA